MTLLYLRLSQIFIYFIVLNNVYILGDTVIDDETDELGGGYINCKI